MLMEFVGEARGISSRVMEIKVNLQNRLNLTIVCGLSNAFNNLFIFKRLLPAESAISRIQLGLDLKWSPEDQFSRISNRTATGSTPNSDVNVRVMLCPRTDICSKDACTDVLIHAI